MKVQKKYSVLRALRAIERSDVVLVVLDGEEGIIEQDKKSRYAHDSGRAVVIVVNKWDAVKRRKTMKAFEENIRAHFQLRIRTNCFLICKTRKRTQTLIPVIDEVNESHSIRIQTNVLNDVIMDAVAMNPTPTHNGSRLKIFYATQVAVKPPTFVVFVNDPELLHFSYERFKESLT